MGEETTRIYYRTQDGGPPLGGRPPSESEPPSPTPPFLGSWQSFFPIGGPIPIPYEFGPPPPYIVTGIPAPAPPPPPPSPPSSPPPPPPTLIPVSVAAYPVTTYTPIQIQGPPPPPQAMNPYPDSDLAKLAKGSLLIPETSLIIHIIPWRFAPWRETEWNGGRQELRFHAHVVPRCLTLDELLLGLKTWGYGEHRQLIEAKQMGNGEWMKGSVYRGGEAEDGGRGQVTLGGRGGFGWGGAGFRERGPVWLVLE